MTDAIRARAPTRALTRRTLLGGLLASVSMASLAPLRGAAARDDEPGDALDAVQEVEVNARPVRYFLSARPDETRFGGLAFRGGLVLTSPSAQFGGWSGLALDADGRRLLAVSDTGAWLSADIEYDSDGAPLGLARARIGPLRALGGRDLRDKAEQDAEALALVDGFVDHGALLIAFERKHRIGRFAIRNGELGPPSEYLKLPPQARRMPENQGFEAVAQLRAGPLKGAIVAFAERYTRGSGYHTGWIWAAGQPHRIQLKDIDGFNITDAAALPDGGLLVLERYFRWTEGVKMRLRHLAPAEIRPAARLTGRILFEGGSSYEIDNMEGLAVHQGPRGETVVSVMSDDNFNRFLQRTVFLQFTLLG
jgi:hypothetical protein